MYDLIIIGTGPAGLAASIYASRYKIKHLVAGKELGGAMALAPRVENYPGFTKISGLELAQKMAAQAKEFGAEIKLIEVTKLTKENEEFVVETAERIYRAKALIVATGTQRRKLAVPGEAQYAGKGVSYCTTCDAAFFKNKTVAVIGGANAAVMGAVHLAEFAGKVYLIYRGKPLRAEPMWVERAEKEPKVEIVYNANVTEVVGDGTKVTGVRLDTKNQQLNLEGVFVEIGGIPGTDLVKPLGVKIDESGYIKVSTDMATNIAGLFAAGDIANVSGEFQQIIIACAEGARAALSVYQYLAS